MKARYSLAQFEEINSRVTDFTAEETQWLHSALDSFYTEIKPGYFMAMFVDCGLVHQAHAYVTENYAVAEIGSGIWCEAHCANELNALTIMKNTEELYPGFQPVKPGDEVVFRIEVPRLSPGFPKLLELGKECVAEETSDYYHVANGADPIQAQRSRSDIRFELLCELEESVCPDPEDHAGPEDHEDANTPED